MIIDAIIFVVIMAVAGVSGRALLKLLPEGALEAILFESALVFPIGLAVVSYLVYIIGNIGQLSILPVSILLAGLFILSLVLIFPLEKRSCLREKLSFAEKIIVLFLCAFGILTLMGALAPAIGTDSLSYHLGIPKKFVLQKRIGFVPYTMNSLFPFFVEILFSVGVLFKSAVSAKLIHWVCGPLMSIAIYSYSRKHIGRTASLLASLLVLASPGIFNEMVYAYVDVALALYTALAVFSLLIWTDNKYRYRYLLLSGLFLGISLSIKYVAVYAAIPMILLLITHLVKGRREVSILKGLLLFFVSCAGVSFFWYLRSYLILGNPIFPVFPEFFDMPIKFEMAHHMKKGMGKGILQLMILPWNLLAHPAGFGSRSSQLGPQFFVLLPFLYFGFRTYKGWFRRLSFIFGTYVFVWFLLAQKDRFLYPMLPILAVLIAASIQALFSRKWKGKKVLVIAAAVLISGSVLFDLAGCLYHNRQNYKVVLGLETREEFLSKWVTNYQMAEFVNENLPEDSKILGIGIYKPYYFDRWVVREGLFDRWEDYRSQYTSSKDIIVYLKAAGFNYVIYKQVNDVPPPVYVKLIAEGKDPIFSYGPVNNAEKPQKEKFFLYKL